MTQTPLEAYVSEVQRKTDAMLAEIQKMTDLVGGILEVALDYSDISEIFRAKITDIRWENGLPIFTIENPVEWDPKIKGWKSTRLSPSELVSHTVVEVSGGQMWMTTPIVCTNDNTVVFLLCHMSSTRVPSRFLISPVGNNVQDEPLFGRESDPDRNSSELARI